MGQAIEIVKRIKQSIILNPNLLNKWKMVFFWLGLNDQCEFCKRKESSPIYYKSYIRKVLAYLQTSLPFVVVNLVSLWDIKQVLALSNSSPYCKGRNIAFRVVCRCASGDTENYRKAQNQALKDIATDYQQMNYSDFKVIYDPSSSNTNITRLNLDILTRTDCMHPNQQTHGKVANILWYNLFQSSENKLTDQYSAFLTNSYKPVQVDCPNTVKYN